MNTFNKRLITLAIGLLMTTGLTFAEPESLKKLHEFDQKAFAAKAGIATESPDEMLQAMHTLHDDWNKFVDDQEEQAKERREGEDYRHAKELTRLTVQNAIHNIDEQYRRLAGKKAVQFYKNSKYPHVGLVD